LEVLELLVHHGADLNAKTKHEETPAGELGLFVIHSRKHYVTLTGSLVIDTSL
jgi:hypothetical protein